MVTTMTLAQAVQLVQQAQIAAARKTSPSIEHQAAAAAEALVSTRAEKRRVREVREVHEVHEAVFQNNNSTIF